MNHQSVFAVWMIIDTDWYKTQSTRSRIEVVSPDTWRIKQWHRYERVIVMDIYTIKYWIVLWRFILNDLFWLIVSRRSCNYHSWYLNLFMIDISCFFLQGYTWCQRHFFLITSYRIQFVIHCYSYNSFVYGLLQIYLKKSSLMNNQNIWIFILFFSSLSH